MSGGAALVSATRPPVATPARAIMVQAALASVLILIGTFDQIIAYFIFITVVFLALTVAGLFILRRREAGALPFRTPGYPVTPAVFLLLVGLLLFLLAAHNPLQALLGVIVVALGAPVYHLATRLR